MGLAEVITSVAVIAGFGYVIAAKMRQKESGKRTLDWMVEKLNPKGLFTKTEEKLTEGKEQLWLEKRNIV